MRSIVCMALLLLLAGCAEPQALPGEAEAPVQAAPTPTLTLVNATAPPPEPLSNITEFYWSTDAELGDAAFAFTIDFGDANDCTVNQAVTGQGEGRRRAVFFYASGWSSGSSGPTAHAAAGPLDTDDVIGAAGEYGSGSASRGTFSGPMTFTRVATGIGPTASDFNSGQSLSFAVECDTTFAIIGAWMGQEALVGDADTLGTAASASLVGGVGAGSQALEITASEGHIRFGSFGEQAGRVTLRSPDTAQEFLLPAESAGALMGGPGVYELEAERAGAYFEAYWHAIYATPHEVDLRAGMRETPAYEFPF